MNFYGLLVGAATFLAIAICHPLVIRSEYYLGKKSWWLYLAAGICCSIISILAEGGLVSTIAGAFAFSLFWGIHEVFEQEKRVLKGWFPENPKRHEYYEELRKRNKR